MINFSAYSMLHFVLQITHYHYLIVEYGGF